MEVKKANRIRLLVIAICTAALIAVNFTFMYTEKEVEKIGRREVPNEYREYSSGLPEGTYIEQTFVSAGTPIYAVSSTKTTMKSGGIKMTSINYGYYMFIPCKTKSGSQVWIGSLTEIRVDGSSVIGLQDEERMRQDREELRAMIPEDGSEFTIYGRITELANKAQPIPDSKMFKSFSGTYDQDLHNSIMADIEEATQSGCYFEAMKDPGTTHWVEEVVGYETERRFNKLFLIVTFLELVGAVRLYKWIRITPVPEALKAYAREAKEKELQEQPSRTKMLDAAGEEKKEEKSNPVPQSKAATDSRIVPEAKAAADSKVVPDSTVAADSRAFPDSTVAADSKAVPESKVSADSKAVPDSTVAADSKATSDSKTAPQSTTAPAKPKVVTTGWICMKCGELNYDNTLTCECGFSKWRGEYYLEENKVIPLRTLDEAIVEGEFKPVSFHFYNSHAPKPGRLTIELGSFEECFSLFVYEDGGYYGSQFARTSIIIPAEIAAHYSHDEIAGLIVRESWVKDMDPEDIRLDEDRIRAFFDRENILKSNCESNTTITLSSYADMFYQYEFRSDGSIVVVHKPTDRLVSDPVGRHVFTAEELKDMQMEDFIFEFYGKHYVSKSHAKPLRKWLLSCEIVFAGVGMIVK